ncbi:hypothetical protein CQW23_02988 [Capsicum baccatum]|uniref:PGG domain-containing protein n=1 Tax=Capsicum baccatum TaxID=33114 RepID=A0A2G2XT03_CAPBA|nr:hypothetical protein CQW23_02988 [Capsicum baccatum]
MEGRLREAAQKGDVHHLRSLINEVPFLLRTVSLAANGDIEIVKELLNDDRNLCLLKGKEIRTPLHYAVIKGREYVMKELLVASPDSAEEVTARGETSLHLAVKNHQFEAFKVLLEESRDGDIEATLRASGAVSVENLQSLQQEGLPHSWAVPVQDPSSREQRRDRPRSISKKLQDFFKYNKSKDPPGKVRDTLLVIAILIATATYQAVLSPAGSVWQDTYWPDDHNGTSNDVKKSSRHIAGLSVMGTNNPIAYGLILVFNSIGFFVSLHTINFLTIVFPLQLELQVSLIALLATYGTVMTAITPSREFLSSLPSFP